MAPLSPLEALADVPDPRSRHGRRHPLPAILSLAVLAMLRGCKGPTAIAQFGRDHGAELAHALFCQRDLCAEIVGRGGDYLLTVKGNQLGLGRDIAAGFGSEAGARGIAAAFSPRAAAAAGAGAAAHQRGEGARPGGEADG